MDNQPKKKQPANFDNKGMLAAMVIKGYNPPPGSANYGQGAFGIRGYEFQATNNGLGKIKM